MGPKDVLEVFSLLGSRGSPPRGFGTWETQKVKVFDITNTIT